MKTPVVTTVLFIAVCLGGGLLIGINNIPGAWYQSLVKPSFNPPNWIFAPAWSILYVLIGIAGARTWLFARRSPAMALWGLQLVLNFLWSPLFFGLQRPSLALLVILPLLLVILAFITLVWNRDRPSALCFLPYAAWVAFASLLNASIVALN